MLTYADDCTIDVIVGSVAEENTWLIGKTKTKILAMLLLEEPDSVASDRRESTVVWRLTVVSLEDRLGRIIDGALVMRSMSPIPFSAGPLA